MHARFVLALGLSLVAGCTNPPGEGAVRVVVLYDFKPGCLEISATETGGQTDSVTLERAALAAGKTTVAVYRKPGWSPDLDLSVRSYEDSCAGDPLEETRSDGPVRLVPSQVGQWVVKLHAADLDGDGFAAKSPASAGIPAIAGTDCNDADKFVHPGAAEACTGTTDFDCDTLVACADPDCLDQPCDDGQPCTQGDRCAVGGACAGAPVVCDSPPGQCRRADGGCDAMGGCFYAVDLNKVCDGGVDGGAAVCFGDGTCRSGEADCADGLDNDGDSDIDCEDSDCLNQACDDKVACTVADTCASVSPTGCAGTAMTCTTPPLDGGCWANTGYCDQGACLYAGASGRSCSDNNSCTLADQCNAAGACAPGPAKVCDTPPAAQCFAASGNCNSLNGVCSYPVQTGSGCSDSLDCTFNDSCQDDGGCSGTAYACDAPSECYDAGSCLGDGGCLFPPRNGLPCDGGICQAGACVPTALFPYVPSNFVPRTDPEVGVNLNCHATFDSNGTGITGNWCSASPVVFTTSAGGTDVIVLEMSSLVITDAGSLTLTGDKPVILAIYGDAHVGGAIYANSQTNGSLRVGAGGDWAGCGQMAGGNGAYQDPAGGGGGGAGFTTPGADGGMGNNNPSTRGPGGTDGGLGAQPLRGGCHGGGGGAGKGASPNSADGGAGGGAVQLSAAGALTIAGTISASGAGGSKGLASSGNDSCGGGGGGSGGMVVLEADQLTVTSSARLTSNGGAGGGGADNSPSSNGGDGSPIASSPAAGGSPQGSSGTGGAGGYGTTPPVVGGSGGKGGAGGGGSVGVIRVRHNASSPGCSVSGSAVISPPAVRQNCP